MKLASYTNELCFVTATGTIELSVEDLLSLDFFNSILQLSSCVYYLFRAPHDIEFIARVRASSKFPRIPTPPASLCSSICLEFVCLCVYLC